MSAQSFQFEAIGTHWQIDIYSAVTPEHFNALVEQVKTRIAQFEQIYSRFKPASLITKIARHAGEYVLPSDAELLLDLYYKLYTITDGAFTPLIGQVLVDAGYDPEYSLQPKPLQTPPAWNEALEYHFPKLRVKQPIQLDFGAAGKGYIIDIIGDLLKASSVKSFCVDAGGDILHYDVNDAPIRIGLENPNNTQQVIGVIELGNASICGSSGNRRKWANFHHTINPHTLASPQHISAIWVLAKTTLLADALATCLWFVEPSILEKKFKFEYLILYPDFTVKQSQNFNAELFSA